MFADWVCSPMRFYALLVRVNAKSRNFCFLTLVLVFVLKLVEQSEEGVCKMECKTIERACQEVLEFTLSHPYFIMLIILGL